MKRAAERPSLPDRPKKSRKDGEPNWYAHAILQYRGGAPVRPHNHNSDPFVAHRGDAGGSGPRDGEKEAKEAKELEKPNYETSGKLEKARRLTKNGIPLKHSEPPVAAKPKRHWRLYVFKDEKIIDTLYIHRQSCFLFGRERRVADIKTDHPTCSKQHAVIQFKLKASADPAGAAPAEVRPYVMDLGSANGTRLNKKRVEAQRYYELLDKDVLNFGHSTRDYVLICGDNN